MAYSLAKMDKKLYIPTMIILTTLMSFASVFSNIYFFMVLPFYVFSFPFFFLPGFFGDTGKITFFQRELFSVSVSSSWDFLIYVFCFFLLINFSGVILGYWIRKETPEKFLEHSLLYYFSRSLFFFLLIEFMFGIIFFPFAFFSWYIWYATTFELILIPAAVAAIIQKTQFMRRQKVLTANNAL
jgi:hypothetical protein